MLVILANFLGFVIRHQSEKRSRGAFRQRRKQADAVVFDASHGVIDAGEQEGHGIRAASSVRRLSGFLQPYLRLGIDLVDDGVDAYVAVGTQMIRQGQPLKELVKIRLKDLLSRLFPA